MKRRLRAGMAGPGAKGFRTWLLHDFALNVLIPIIVVIAVTATSDVSPTMQLVGGRGEFALMAVAVSSSSHVTARRTVRLKPVDNDDEQSLPQLTWLIVIISAAVWGSVAGMSNAEHHYDHELAAWLSLFLLTVACTLGIAIAIGHARAASQQAPLTLLVKASKP